jgi:hypothetical protein
MKHRTNTSTNKAETLPPTRTDRPVINYKTSDIAEHSDTAIVALAADKDIYTRASRLVHVARAREPDTEAVPTDAAEVTRTADGAPLLHLLERDALRARLSRIVEFKKYDGRRRKMTSCAPPDHLVGDILTRKAWAALRPIVGIAEAPFMRPDGTICSTPGYDAATRFLYAPNTEFPPIGKRPTRREAGRALEEIVDFLVDFNFRDPWGRSVVVAALLTLLARPAIQGSTPAFVLDANVRGAGKSRLMDIVAIIATGRAMPRKVYPHAEAELAKVLDAYALAGARIICLDNVDVPFGGAALDAALTTPEGYEVRVLGKTEVPCVDWSAVIFATGNNIAFRGDTADRVIRARLLSESENPRARAGFKYDPILDEVHKARPRLVAAVLTILRAYVVAGRRDMKTPPFGSFESWSRLVPHAIVFAGGESPMTGRILDAREANPTDQALAAFLAGFDALILRLHAGAVRQEAVRAKQEKRAARTLPVNRYLPSTELLRALYDDAAIGIDVDFDEMRAALETLVTPGRRVGESRPTVPALSSVLAAHRDRRIAGFFLTRDFDNHGKRFRWSVSSVPSAGAAGVADPLSSRTKEVSLLAKYRGRRNIPPATPASPAVAKRRLHGGAAT